MHVTINQLRGQLIIFHLLLCLFWSLCCDNNKPNKSKNHTSIPFITWFRRKSNCFQYFKIRNSVWIIEGLDNGDSDNWGPTDDIIYHFHTLDQRNLPIHINLWSGPQSQNFDILYVAITNSISIMGFNYKCYNIFCGLTETHY